MRDRVSLKTVSVSLPFGIGSMSWEADRTERKAAWSLYVELVTRIAVQPLEVDQGLVREALNSLYRLMWVDFRSPQPDPMGQLLWGITGKKPGTRPTIQLTAPQTDDLSSEKGIDYTRLRDLLAAHNWEEADQETYRVMIQAVGKKDGNWFTSDELLNFPCIDLRTIDHLWVKYSNGHFGFSVQKEIYLSVGGKADGKYYAEVWEKFGDRVGWRVESSWISYSEVTFNTSSPKGHLPIWVPKVPKVPGLRWWVWVSRMRVEWISSLASRLVNCNI